MKKQTLNATQMEILKGILRTTQAGLKKTMEEYLISQYGEKNVIIEKEYVIALGTTPIGLVAHMDTVHTNQPVNIFFVNPNNFSFWRIWARKNWNTKCSVHICQMRSRATIANREVKCFNRSKCHIIISISSGISSLIGTNGLFFVAN